jgi:hypothetical protein
MSEFWHPAGLVEVGVFHRGREHPGGLPDELGPVGEQELPNHRRRTVHASDPATVDDSDELIGKLTNALELHQTGVKVEVLGIRPAREPGIRLGP